MDFKQIQQLIKLVDEKELSELKIKNDGFEISIRSKHFNKNSGNPIQQVAAAPAQVIAASPVAAPVDTAANTGSPEARPESPTASEDSNYLTIKSPMIGTFYRASGPDKDPFVKVGDSISKGSVLCIVEAMKLFNEIESDLSGKIVKVLVDDASPVEYDQPLFLVAP